MESSQLVGGTEECCSSESGWTMYIASPMHGPSGDYSDSKSIDEGSGNDQDSDGDDDDDGNTSDSDDSMASDASSGRAHLETSHSSVDNGKGSSKPDEDEEKKDEDEEDEEDDRRAYGGKASKGRKAERKRDRK